MERYYFRQEQRESGVCHLSSEIKDCSHFDTSANCDFDASRLPPSFSPKRSNACGAKEFSGKQNPEHKYGNYGDMRCTM